MALIKCPECQQEISEEAVACPNCGFPVAKITTFANEIIVVRRGFALAAVIIASIYTVFSGMFCIGHVPGLMWDTNVLINGMGYALYVHVVLMIIGIVFGWSGFFTKRRNQVLISAILYSVAAFFFLLWLLLLVLPIVLGFVGYARMKPKRVRLDEYLLD